MGLCFHSGFTAHQPGTTMARHNRRQTNTQPAQSTSSTPFTYQPISHNSNHNNNNNNNNNNNQPKRPRPSANERVLQELRSRTALRHSSMDPNSNIQDGQEIEVTRFEIHDRAYRPQSVYVFPFGEDSSDETLRTMIENVLQDSLIITACRPPLRLVSFDMEWVTDHRARKPRPTSLIQICGQTITLVIQLVHIQRPKWFLHVLPTPIAEFLRDPFIVKFGVGISGDADKLARDQFTDPTGSKVYLNAFLELIDVAKLIDPTARDDIPTDAFSLQRFVARYLEQFLPKTKSVVTSNWESFYLSPTQLNYAASDVISAMRVYLKLYMLPAHHPRFMPPIRYAAANTM
ncbi:Exonuclease 3'-5' domain-containing protein 2, variant 2 [Puccinia graminis f. sp. tritici]|uniref:Exonuclease 3'-5' domain-containing protein 2, variant 2 n=2 Tax=Puccinia graminis f. sp. tritici TaxID=56615 RepID=A0A5B0LLV5_PUCGR|nr:Exonuclease 3'-5' domain-containing protein 2, variant 2 [Puccinia graminis f. sp. tritici]